MTLAPDSMQQLVQHLGGALVAALPAALRALHLAPDAVQKNNNASRRSNAELLTINLPVPEDAAAQQRLAKDTLLVSSYLRKKFAETSLSETAQRQSVAGFRSMYSQALKMKQRELGDAPMAGQMGWAQMHYTHTDRPLMDQGWADLGDFREALVRRILCQNARAAAHDAARSRSPRQRL